MCRRFQHAMTEAANITLVLTSPDDFSVIYDVNNSYLGLDQTIAIIGRSRVYEPDLQNFESLTGITFGTPTVIVPPNGQDPGQPAGRAVKRRATNWRRRST